MTEQHTLPYDASAVPNSSLLQRAIGLYETQRFGESEVLFEQLLATGSSTGEALYGLGMVRLGMSDIDTARSYFHKTIQAQPTNGNAWYQLGLIAENQGLTDIARATYEKSVEVQPQHASAIQRLRQLAPLQPPVQDPVPLRTNNSANIPGHNLPDGLTPPYEISKLIGEDSSPLAKHTLAAIHALDMRVKPKLLAYLGRGDKVILLMVVLLGLAFALSAVLNTTVEILLDRAGLYPVISVLLALRGLPSALVPLVIWLFIVRVIFLAVNVATTTIVIADGKIQIEKGVFGKHIEIIELYRVRNPQLHQTFINRLTSDGTIILTVDSLAANRREEQILLVGLAKYRELQTMLVQLRDLVLMLRTGPWGKGVIY